VSAVDRELLPQHRALLEASAIGDEVARERGYWSATRKTELEELGFGRKAQRVPSLVIPVRGVTGELEWCAHRPDEPRVADGTSRKYEIPYGARQVLDVPSRALPLLRDPAAPLIITEGARKVDSALSHGLACVIGVFGTYAFRGTDKETQGKVMLGDWEHVALKNGADEPRDVWIAFDSDVMRKPEVQVALDRLAALLYRRGARVGFILLPEGEHRSKVGLDDFFAGGGTVEEMWSFATTTPPRWVRPDNPERPTTGDEDASLSEESFRGADLTPPEKPPLADEPDLLAEFLRDLRSAGLAGEQRGAQIIVLALTSRLLPWGTPGNRPVSVIPKGTTSTGKSYTLEMVLRFFPPEAYFNLGTMSKKYLLYTDESLVHRILVIPEWAMVAEDNELVASLRSLLSEGRLIHGTVDGDGRREARLIQKDGPTGLLMTTTVSSVDPELETRCLSYLTDDTPEQTRRVFEALAELEDNDELPVDFDRWHQLQRWIAAGESRVHIPFVRRLAERMPTAAPRLRRDFVSMLCLVRAHAVLHQATRERDDQGRIVATAADYAAVHELLDELVAEAVEATVSGATRETVQAVRDLLAEDGGEHVSVKKIADRLGIGKSATYDRVGRATAAGFLANLAKKDERGWKVALGADLPAGGTFLPSPDEVFRVDSDDPTGNENGPTTREPNGDSAFPAFPADTGRLFGDEAALAGRQPDIPCIERARPSKEQERDDGQWLARDGAWRSFDTDPPVFASEVVETRHGGGSGNITPPPPEEDEIERPADLSRWAQEDA
jgi:hypothetical protein